MTGQAELVAAVRGGRSIVWVTPPQAVHADDFWVALTERDRGAGAGPVRSLVVVSTVGMAHDVARVAGGVPVSGLTRAAQALARSNVTQLISTPEDAIALLARTALKLESLDRIVLAWPEPLLTPDRESALDQLLAEVRQVPRFVLAWNPGGLERFLERHAHRAPVVGPLATAPWPVEAACRYHVVGAGGAAAELERVLDALSPERYAVWRLGDPAPVEQLDLVLAVDLPSPSTLMGLAAMGPVVALVSAAQLAYLKAVAPKARPLAFPSAADEARSRAAALRTRVAEVIEREDLDAEVLLLDPLFERFEPAEVAAALVRLAAHVPETDTGESESTVWAKLFVNAGRRDRLRPGDLVGALINEVGLAKSQIGRIELRESHCTVEIAAAAAARAAEGLSSTTVRGRRLGARLDRKG